VLHAHDTTIALVIDMLEDVLVVDLAGGGSFLPGLSPIWK